MRIIRAINLDPTEWSRQRRPLLAVAKRLEGRGDRDDCLQRCVELAADKAAAGLDRPIAAWQKSVNEMFPPDELATESALQRIGRMVG